MSWSDWLRIGGGIAGGIGGAFIPGVGPVAGAGLGMGAGGAIGGAIDGGGDDSQLNENIALWKAALAELENPTGDRAAAREMLKRLATTSGLLPEEKALLMQASLDAGQMANAREQSIISDAQARGGGQAIGGATLALQQGASQAAGQRYALQAGQAAGQASQRQQAAIRAFNDEMDRAMQMRLAATGGLSGVRVAAQDFAERRNEANTQNWAGMANNLAGVGMYMNDPVRKALADKISGASSVQSPQMPQHRELGLSGPAEWLTPKTPRGGDPGWSPSDFSAGLRPPEPRSRGPFTGDDWDWGWGGGRRQPQYPVFPGY